MAPVPLMRGVVALGVLCTRGAAKFLPFADVEELKPQRLAQFCSDLIPREQGGDGSLRFCENRVVKRLEDGGDVEFSWKAKADPDKFLSLDTEEQHGVRMVSCGPSEVEIVLPETHLRHATVGHTIVASSFAHSCAHLNDKHAYLRIEEVRHRRVHTSPEGVRTTSVSFLTKELPSFSHAVPSMDFYFSYAPVEAIDPAEEPEMRTDFGINREYMKRKAREALERRLHSPSKITQMLNRISDGIEKLKENPQVTEDNGGFETESESEGKYSSNGDFVNLLPKQVSNFGWFWDFDMETKKSPVIVIDAPGAKGNITLHKPIIKIHSIIFLNFSSCFTGFSTPEVRFRYGMKGYGRLQGRVKVELDTTEAAGVDPLVTFQEYDIPLMDEMEKWEKGIWFHKIQFAAGDFPICFEPGFKMTGKIYHQGLFRGAFAIGGKVHGNLMPILNYDSNKGFNLQCEGLLKNVRITPPLWMIFTRQFELGIQLRPSIMVRGDFAEMENVTIAVDFRPYMNFTVSRGHKGRAEAFKRVAKPLPAVTGFSAGRGGPKKKLRVQTPPTGPTKRTLVVYPIRIVGIQDVSLSKTYKLKFEFSSVPSGPVRFDTQPQLNLGEVQFKEIIDSFEVADLTKEDALKVTGTVTLYQVDGTNTLELGTAAWTCGTLTDKSDYCGGEPAFLNIKSGGAVVAAVQVAGLWTEYPRRWLAGHLRGISLSLHDVLINEEQLQSDYQRIKGDYLHEDAPRAIHVIQGEKRHIIGLDGQATDTVSSWHGDTVLDYPPFLVHEWRKCPADVPACRPPRLEFYAGGEKLGESIFFPFKDACEDLKDRGGFELEPIQVTISSGGVDLLIVTTKIILREPSHAIRWVSPRALAEIPLSSYKMYQLAVPDVEPGEVIYFTFSAFLLKTKGPEDTDEYRTYGNKILKPLTSASEDALAVFEGNIAGARCVKNTCVYQKDLTFFSPTFIEGNEIIFYAEWKQDGCTHAAFAPPLKILAPVPPGSGRRLLHDDGFDNEDWDAQIAANRESCEEEDLDFKIGSGILARASLSMPLFNAFLPQEDAMDDEYEPDFCTKFRKIDAVGYDEGNLTDLFPRLLCDAGVCQAELPGCRKAGQTRRELSFPKILINFNRDIGYDQMHVLGTDSLPHPMRTAMALAFSTLPEAVEVASKEIAELEKDRKAGKHITPKTIWSDLKEQFRQRTGIGSGTQTPCPDDATKKGLSSFASPASDVAPASGPSRDTVNKAYNGFWALGSTSAGRRLDALELKPHQVLVTFKKGLPFKVTNHLLDIMIANDMFMEVDDAHSEKLGPLKVVSYELDEGTSVSVPIDEGDYDTLPLASKYAAELPVEGHRQLLMATLAVGAGVAITLVALAALALRVRLAAERSSEQVEMTATYSAADAVQYDSLAKEEDDVQSI